MKSKMMRLNEKNKALIVTSAAMFLMLFFASSVMAQGSSIGLGAVTGNVKGQLQTIPDVLAIISYLGAIYFAIRSAVKFKESNESKGQVPMSQPITLLLVSGLLFALPTLMDRSTETIFGNSTNRVTLDGWDD